MNRLSFLISFSLIILMNFAPAQTFDGRVYIQTSVVDYNKPIEFGYVQFPDGQYHFVDSLFVNDFMIYDDVINIAGKDLIRMDLDTHQVLHTAQNIHAKSLDLWGDKIAVISDSMPYLRVYHSDLTLDFTLDTSLLKGSPNDILVNNDKAFVTLHDQVKIFNLKTKDSIANQNKEIPVSLFGTFEEMVRVDTKVYTKFEWWTGAPWISLWEIDLAADSIIMASEMIFGSLYLDITARNEGVYTGLGLSYYDFDQDSIFQRDHNFKNAIAYDDSTTTLYAVGKVDLQTEEYALLQFSDTVLTDSVLLPYNIRRARLANKSEGNPDFILREKPVINMVVVPNPNHGLTIVSWDPGLNKAVSLSVYNVNGQRILRKDISATDSKYTFDTTLWQKGYYIVELISQKGRGAIKMVVD